MSPPGPGGPGAEDALLTVRGLTVRFAVRHGVIEAVRGVDLALRPGECLAVVGESGSGKSVTARALVGLAGPGATVDASELSLEGQELLRCTERQWRRLRGARIGFAAQDALTSLDPLRRVGDEVGEPLAVHGLAARRARAEQVISLLSDVGITDPRLRARQYPHELSGGLRQRALIASAIAAGPSLLIADEPTTALDVTVQAQVLDLLAARRDAGTAVLLISHDLTVVARMADQVAVMYAGLVVEQGPAGQLLTAPAHPYTRDLLAAAPSPDLQAPRPPPAVTGALAPPDAGPGCPYASRCLLADSRCRTELPPLAGRAGTAADPGARVRCWHPGSAGTGVSGLSPAEVNQARTGAVILEIDAASKRFRSPDRSWRQAIDRVSFQLHEGESLGLVGESGSGKTTTALIAAGLLEPDSGKVRLGGAPWSGLRESERRPRRSQVQVIDQDTLGSFDPRFTVERTVGEALGHPTRRGAAANRSRITELLGRVGLDESILTRRPSELSGGQRQRVAIARALAPKPKLIICDEPVSALDVTVQAQVLHLFTALHRELGVAFLFISHDLGVIRQVCDSVLVMKDGAVVEHGAVTDVFAAPRHPYTQALLAAATRAPDHPATDLTQPSEWFAS